MLKEYKYFATRVGDMVIIRRVLKELKVIQSKLYKPGSEFALKQVSFTGGKVIGAIKFTDYTSRCGSDYRFGTRYVVRLDRSIVRALKPFLISGE